MNRDAKLISGILSWCNSTDDILDEFNRDEEEFFKRASFQYSLSFCAEQIGHKAEQLDPKIREKYSEINWNDMVGVRIDIAHFHETQDLDVIWDFATKKVPKLRKVCERIFYEMTKR